MPMERSVSCADRSSGATAAPHLRSYSASYAPRVPAKVRRAQSATSWSRPAPGGGGVPRSGSVRAAAAAPRLNLRSFSASYAASYAPCEDAGAAAAAGGGGGQLRRSGSVTNWSSSNRRSVNLRGYTPSFSALERTAAVAPAPAPKKAVSGGALDDADLQRKKRLVVYKAYDMEGRVRSSVRRGVQWIKSKFSLAVHGWS